MTIVDASAVGDRVIDVAAGVTAQLTDLTVRGGSPSAASGRWCAGAAS